MPVIRKNMAPLSSTLWTPLSNAARILNLAGHFEEAEQLERENMAVVEEQKLLELDPRRAVSLSDLGTALQGGKGRIEFILSLVRCGRCAPSMCRSS
jgi:hypothetical protein